VSFSGLKTTFTSVSFPTTCQFVSICPDEEIMLPEPNESFVRIRTTDGETFLNNAASLTPRVSRRF
jgi:hypothetical protein